MTANGPQQNDKHSDISRLIEAKVFYLKSLMTSMSVSFQSFTTSFKKNSRGLANNVSTRSSSLSKSWQDSKEQNLFT